MTKEELVELFSNLHPEDSTGQMIGEVHLADGRVMKTDSLRVDMDGGRIIISEKHSSMHEATKRIGFKNSFFIETKNVAQHKPFYSIFLFLVNITLH
ncbi:MAG: hypothetical protein ABS21_02560 [SAR86 cluster bacterium BACL1 MAG-121105-bin34]|nr:MAG: hypothetical protein ABS21_02560 [SAR86 cluster bacterium BACL1 MAG-121105-bin34]